MLEHFLLAIISLPLFISEPVAAFSLLALYQDGEEETIRQLLEETLPLNESISDQISFDDLEGDFKGLQSSNEEPYYTTASGKVVPDPYHVQTAGYYGPVLLEDFPFRQIMGHFDRERIPERMVHARGAGAFGYFECTNPKAHELTLAVPFQKVGKRTRVAVRLSTSHGSAGSPDIKFDLRGFAIKFYTEQGNWDLTMLSAPAFFIKDPIMLPNLIHSARSDPKNNVFDYSRYFDLLSLMPESLLAASMAFAGAGSSKNYRHVTGFSVNTFKFINKKNQFWFVRFKVEADAGPNNLTIEELQDIYKNDLDYATRDLYDSIERKKYPSWTVYVQMLSPERAQKMSFNILDTTKEWPEELVKPIELGRMILDENPENFFAQVEQMAFNPANTIPGIDFTFDKMLQGRLFAYQDTQFHRMGVNYYSLPVNKPIAPTMQINVRDGQGQFGKNWGSLPDYIPNSFYNIKKGAPSKYTLIAPSAKLEVTHFDTDDEDNYSQVTAYWKRLDPSSRWLLIHNMAKYLVKVKPNIQDRWLSHVKIASKDYYYSLLDELNKLRS